MQVPEDRIDRTRAEWASESPDLDTTAMEIIGRVLRVEHLAGQRIRTVLRREQLDRGGFDVLATLRRTGAPYRLTPTALYRELVLTSGAITHRVDALERAGLVKRVADKRDRRSSEIGLTAKGKAVIDRAMAAHLDCEMAMLKSLTATDRKALAVLLRKLLHGLEKESTNGAE
ncbi:MAG: MarR family transcriptional regulator [Mycobacterium sp.]|nr:MarR family transcriptional regulator [Mycobacterium sp.]